MWTSSDHERRAMETDASLAAGPYVAVSNTVVAVVLESVVAGVRLIGEALTSPTERIATEAVLFELFALSLLVASTHVVPVQDVACALPLVALGLKSAHVAVRGLRALRARRRPHARLRDAPGRPASSSCTWTCTARRVAPTCCVFHGLLLSHSTPRRSSTRSTILGMELPRGRRRATCSRGASTAPSSAATTVASSSASSSGIRRRAEVTWLRAESARFPTLRGVAVHGDRAFPWYAATPMGVLCVLRGAAARPRANLSGRDARAHVPVTVRESARHGANAAVAPVRRRQAAAAASRIPSGAFSPARFFASHYPKGVLPVLRRMLADRPLPVAAERARRVDHGRLAVLARDMRSCVASRSVGVRASSVAPTFSSASWRRTCRRRP